MFLGELTIDGSLHCKYLFRQARRGSSMVKQGVGGFSSGIYISVNHSKGDWGKGGGRGEIHLYRANGLGEADTHSLGAWSLGLMAHYIVYIETSET